MSYQLETPKDHKPISASAHAQAVAAHEKALKQQKASSLLIAILIHALIIFGFGLWIIASPEPDPAEIQVRVSNSPEFKPVTKRETQVSNRKPSPPSASSKLITTATTSDVFVPEVDSTAFEGLGAGTGLGVGLGMGGFGDGGGGGSETVFFNQKASAERVVFVVDYSASMNGQRIKLLKSELSQTMKLLGDGVDYQLIFFAGPAWVAGDKVKMAGQKSAEVEGDRGHKYDWECKGGAHNWDTKGSRQQPDWITKSKSTLKKSLDSIQETPLVWGTDWEGPLEMALSMEPEPQIVFFMTDGASGPNSMDIAEDIGRKAKSKKIVVNTIALMQPKAADPMRELAKRTKGKFTIVSANGETQEEDFGN